MVFVPSASLSDRDALSREADALFLSRRFTDAHTCLTAALDIWAAPALRSELHLKRAQALAHDGKHQRAIADARRAVALSGGTARSRDVLKEVEELASTRALPQPASASATPVNVLSAFLSVLEEDDEEQEQQQQQQQQETAPIAAATKLAMPPAPAAEPASNPARAQTPPAPASAPTPAFAPAPALALAEKLDDDAIIARLEALGADWRSAPAKLRSLLQDNGIIGVSEKRVRLLKAKVLPPEKPPPPPPPPAEGSDWGDEIESRPGRGRCAIATAPMRAGSVVQTFSGKPYDSCLLPAQQPRRCQYCYDEPKENGKLLKCGKCHFACWCSNRCRTADAQRHSHECATLANPTPALKRLREESAPMGGTNLGRFAVLLLASRCLWRRHESGGRSDAFHDRLFDHLCQGPITEQDQEVGAIAEGNRGFLPPGVDGKRVAQLLGQLRINVISIASRQHVQHSPDAEGNSVIGVGCYPRTAILNHSCRPNCVLAYVGEGATLHVRTAREIAAGEELCHSYTELCTPTRLRRQALSNRYGFECVCERCNGLEYEGEDVDFLMEAVVGSDEGGEGGGGDGSGGGGGGGDAAEEAGMDELIRSSEEQLAMAEQVADLTLASRLTAEALQVRRRHCHPLSLLRHHAEQAAFDLHVRTGNLEGARECCLAVLAFLEMALSHVPWHPALSLERYQAAMLEARLGNGGNARALIELAVAALEVTHGSEHSLTQRAIARKAELDKAQQRKKQQKEPPAPPQPKERPVTTLGAKWLSRGAATPSSGRELTNAKLSFALKRNTEFNHADLRNFGLPQLRPGDYIKSGASYFQVAPVTRPYYTPVD